MVGEDQFADFGKSFGVAFFAFKAHHFNLYRLTIHTSNGINSKHFTIPVLWPYLQVLNFWQKLDIITFQEVNQCLWFLYGLKACIFIVLSQLPILQNTSK
jgi:hypothetical protein